MDERERVQERYERFAREEALGRSEVYAVWALRVARDDEVAAVLARVPAAHRQPPLVFAVMRMLGADAGSDADGWARFVGEHADEIVAECSVRAVQTNEPLRCAALLPVLSMIPGPIALLELGASAGLCLYPDRYSYRYATPTGERAIDPVDAPSRVVLTARMDGRAPVLRTPEIVWRAGIDRQPRRADDPVDRSWITGLVWPGEEGRAERIAAALDIVAADPPLLVEGDAGDLALVRAVAAGAPAGTTLVVTTPGILPYLPRAERDALIAGLGALAGHWITLDAPALHGAWSRPIDPADWPGGFALAIDGDVLAATDPLGAWVRWRA